MLFSALGAQPGPCAVGDCSVDDFANAPDVIEDAETFAGNARKKASELARAVAQWVIADDSGLAVDALDGAPVFFRALCRRADRQRGQ